jgi:hypothetical protein
MQILIYKFITHKNPQNRRKLVFPTPFQPPHLFLLTPPESVVAHVYPYL